METRTNHSVGILEQIYKGDEEGLERAKNPIISSYQRRLIDNGWIFSTNEIATNYHIGIDLPHEPLKDSLRRMKKDFETRICPGKRVGFFRAYNTSGERIPSSEMFEFFGKSVATVAVYVRDLE